MTTTQITFHPRNYYPMAFVNLIDKLENLFGVQQVERVSATRLAVTMKSKRKLKRLMRVCSRESAVLHLQFHVEQRTQSFSGSFWY